jgi:uncharacterized protein
MMWYVRCTVTPVRTVSTRLRASAARLAATIAILLPLLWPASRLSAQPPGAIAVPAPVGYVNDFAGVLTPEAKARLEELSQRLNAATRGELVIVTMADLGGRPKEDVARELGRQWKVGAGAKIGDAARNAGVIVLVVPKETSSDGGHCRIEVGQGAEGFITDATSGTLCRDATPQFRVRDYSGAIEYIAGAISERYAESFGVTLDGGAPNPSRSRRSERSGDQPGPSPFMVLLAIIIIVMVLSSMGRRRRGCVGCLPIPIPGPRIGGGFGGGGFSGGFGGGGFGGGGGGGFGGFGGGGGFSGGGGGSDW